MNEFAYWQVEDDTPLAIVSVDSAADIDSAAMDLIFPDETTGSVPGTIDLDANEISFQLPALPAGVTRANVRIVNDAGQLTFPDRDFIRFITRSAA